MENGQGKKCLFLDCIDRLITLYFPEDLLALFGITKIGLGNQLAALVGQRQFQNQIQRMMPLISKYRQNKKCDKNDSRLNEHVARISDIQIILEQNQGMLQNYSKKKLIPFMSKIENLLILDFYLQNLNEYNRHSQHKTKLAGHCQIK